MPDPPHTPRDDFPPFGYLDNPSHSWKLNPSGVLRSRPPAGMGWHRPNHGSYGRNQFQDRAHLHVGIEVDGLRLVRASDFAAAGVSVGCDLHTGLRLRYVWRHPADIEVAALYHLAHEQALSCQIEMRAAPDSAPAAGSPRQARLWLAVEIAHNPATSRLWEHGLYAVPPAAFELAPGADDALAASVGLLGICPEGDVWALGASQGGQPLVPSITLHHDAGWLADGPIAPAPPGTEPANLQRATLALGYDLALPAAGVTTMTAVLACGVNADHAHERWSWSVRNGATTLAARTQRDEAFWMHAPQLSGDWPVHWRRGFVTDFETLRMVARPAAGCFDGPWDGMQIQAPRLVLAEAALDALALSWADPALARQLLLECFTSAARPNVPCMREDGSYNMVADDGTVCGTGPEWGWPLLVAELLWARSGDRDWLSAIYPYLAAYQDWWLTQRVDAEGWLVHACSWESGQDVSARFGEQQTGGSDVRHLRPVDLQAAAAQGAALLAGWAATLDRPMPEREHWVSVSARLHALVEHTWHDGWYHDFDTRQGRWSGVRDPMQLAPLVSAGVGPAVPAAHIQALRAAYDALPPHGGTWPALVWPPVAFTVLEAAQAAGLPARATQLATQIVERAWQRMDARTLEPDGALPGVTRECWPEGGETSAGIEGYGWGALTIDLLMSHVVGLRASAPQALVLTPALPPLLRKPGATYTIGPLAGGPGTLRVSYAIPADARAADVEVTLTLTGATDPFGVREPHSEHEITRAEPDAAGIVRLHWRGAWLAQYHITSGQ